MATVSDAICRIGIGRVGEDVRVRTSQCVNCSRDQGADLLYVESSGARRVGQQLLRPVDQKVHGDELCARMTW
jgi:hypothetical protein